MTPMKIHEAQEALEDAQHRYLRKRGWEYTCDNPASTWLWEKALPDGRVVLVATELAVSLQGRADCIALDFWPAAKKAA